MLHLQERRRPYAVCTIVHTEGSVPAKLGAVMIVTSDGAPRGTVGGAGLEERVKKMALEALRTGQGGLHRFDLANWKEGGLNSVCGGTVDISILVHRPLPHLLLYGGGHCGKALHDIAQALDWDVTIVDERAEYADAQRFPHAVATHAGDPATWTRTAPLDDYTHAFLLGHSWETDTAILAQLLPRFPRFVGVIGSQAKRQKMTQTLLQQGLAPAQAQRFVTPIGLDIGAQAPEEIAVAVAAQVIQLLKSHPAPLEVTR